MNLATVITSILGTSDAGFAGLKTLALEIFWGGMGVALVAAGSTLLFQFLLVSAGYKTRTEAIREQYGDLFDGAAYEPLEY